MENNTKLAPITVAVTVNAPVEKVWNLFNAPEHITRWCAASDDWHAPSAEADVREGGKAKTRMEAKDGSMGFDFEYTYTKVNEHETIHYVMADGRRVEITFETAEGGTRVTETFDPEGTNPPEMQRGGWQAILDNFKKYVEQH